MPSAPPLLEAVEGAGLRDVVDERLRAVGLDGRRPLGGFGRGRDVLDATECFVDLRCGSILCLLAGSEGCDGLIVIADAGIDPGQSAVRGWVAFAVGDRLCESLDAVRVVGLCLAGSE